MISIIIATKNRPVKLKKLLASIKSSTSIETIIINQGDNSEIKNIIKHFPRLNIIYRHLPKGGKSKALNKAFSLASGDIYVFTDDDCITDKNWLKNIESFYNKSPNVDGVFGKTLPYEPSKHRGLLCHTVFTKKNKFITNNPNITFYKDLGIGNNMSFRANVVKKVKFFQEWLGVGSISKAGGIEGEFIYRVLKNNFTLAYEPSIVVYHDKWLTWEEEETLQSKYFIGTTAFYFYHLIKSKDTKLIKNIFELRFHFTEKIRSVCNKIVHLKFPYQELFFIFIDVKSFFKGMLLGINKAKNK